MKKRVILIIFLLFSFMGICACSDIKSKIYINGNIQEIVEVNSNYIDSIREILML